MSLMKNKNFAHKNRYLVSKLSFPALVVCPAEIFTDEVVEFVVERPEKFSELFDEFVWNDRVRPALALCKTAFFVGLKFTKQWFPVRGIITKRLKQFDFLVLSANKAAKPVKFVSNRVTSPVLTLDKT